MTDLLGAVPDGMPANNGWPVCRTLLMRPCMGSGPFTTSAPCACARACMPKQTPNTGNGTFLSRMARDSPVVIITFNTAPESTLPSTRYEFLCQMAIPSHNIALMFTEAQAKRCVLTTYPHHDLVSGCLDLVISLYYELNASSGKCPSLSHLAHC